MMHHSDPSKKKNFQFLLLFIVRMHSQKNIYFQDAFPNQLKRYKYIRTDLKSIIPGISN